MDLDEGSDSKLRRSSVAFVQDLFFAASVRHYRASATTGRSVSFLDLSCICSARLQVAAFLIGICFLFHPFSLFLFLASVLFFAARITSRPLRQQAEDIFLFLDFLYLFRSIASSGVFEWHLSCFLPPAAT